MSGPTSPFPPTSELSRYELVEGLRAWAAGTSTTEAAVELLIGHGSWLARNDFCELLWVEDDVVGLDPEEIAALSFLAPASRSELAVLTLAVGLLGVEIVDPLADLLVSLDDPTLALVIEAVARCGSWNRRGQLYLATGRFDDDAPPGAVGR